jgi:DNA-directed RNA polymerase subunit alpha
MQESWTDLSKPKSIEPEEETLTSTYGRFFGEPFERGFGTTLGNALRRALLSSLSGAAITKVRIKGVLHEFSTVPGVTEDVTDILLNLKEIRFRLRDTDTETARLDVRKEGEVAAAALEIGPRAEILNPGTHIATLGKDARLELEAVIHRGRGYVTAERHKSEDDPLGTIPLDAAFSPVRKVNFTITNARVGQRTDYERLSLEIWTDGSIGPREALASAAREIQEQLSIFVAGSVEIGELPTDVTTMPAVSINENLLRPIEELNLSVRSNNCLQSADLRYVGELVQKTEAELLRTKNFGRKSLNEIKETLHNMGLELGMRLESFPSREELERRRIAQERDLA